MPRAVQTPEEITVIRDKILDIAAQLIIEEGFNKLSMRKIASRQGIIAAKLFITALATGRSLYMFYEKERIGYDGYHSPVDRF